MKKTRWITNENCIDYNNGSDSRIDYVLAALYATRPEYPSCFFIPNSYAFTPPGFENCPVCGVPTGCSLRFTSGSFSFENENFAIRATGGEFYYDVLNAQGGVIASLYGRGFSSAWRSSQNNSYVYAEIVIQGSSDGYNANSEARFWLVHYLTAADLQYKDFQVEFSSDSLCPIGTYTGEDKTSEGLNARVFYQVDSSLGLKFPLCDVVSNVCYPACLGSNATVSYSYDSTSGLYVPTISKPGEILYQVVGSNGSTSKIYAKELSSNDWNIETYYDSYYGFKSDVAFYHGELSSQSTIVFQTLEKITEPISGTLDELVTAGYLSYSIFPKNLDGDNVSLASFYDSNGNCGCDGYCGIGSIRAAYSLPHYWIHNFVSSYESEDDYFFYFEIYSSNNALMGSMAFQCTGDAGDVFSIYISDDLTTLYAVYNRQNERSFTYSGKTYRLCSLEVTLTTTINSSNLNAVQRTYTNPTCRARFEVVS